MNKYFKEFLHRGLIFGGFGPMVLGIIYAILESTIENFAVNGVQILIGIISVYLLAFIQAGISVFNQMEHWSFLKRMLCHFSILYVAYVVCYLVNNWIPFNPNVLIIFTAIFLGIYLLVWLIVNISVRIASKKLNAKIK